MTRSLFSGVSGLKTHQSRMDVVGNNIANVNTTGFKASRMTFADTLYQTQAGASSPNGSRGGTNPKQVGLGVGVSTIDTLFTDASPSATGKNTDLALSGNGLFVVKDGTGTYYTRDGSFEFDAQGNYVLPGSGKFVQGWMADAEGNLTTTGGTTDIVIPSGQSIAPKATTKATFANNLNASLEPSKVKSTIVTYDDGTTETTDAYEPTIIDAIVVTGTDAGTYYVPRTGTTPKYATEQKLTRSWTNNTLADESSAIWSSKVTEATLVPGVDSSITLGTGTNTPISINGVTSLKLTNTGLVGGTYKIGDTYSLKKTITKATLDTSTHQVTLEFAAGTDGITSVVVPEPTSGGFYSKGDEFEIKMQIQAITASKGDTITCENGESVTLEGNPKDPTTQNVGENYKKTIEGTVESVNDHVGYSFHGKTVKSIVLQSEDNTTIAGDISKAQTAQTVPGSVLTLFSVFDSEGGSTDLPVMLRKMSDNTWQACFSDGTTSYKFMRDDGVTGTATLDATNLVFDTSGKYVSGSGTIDVANDSGLPANQTLSMDFSTLTQYTGSSTVHAENDGYAAGTLASVSVDTSGVISGTYTNGEIRSLAQVAVAQFNNAAGLTRTGGNFFQTSNNSGSANIKTASDLGCTITPSALEMSNVDLANEFSSMIITQRGYQANSKMITVSDEMLETLINTKR